MDEFQINVSVDGQFLFRTDWESNKARVKQTIDDLAQVPGYQLTVYLRTTGRRNATHLFIKENQS